jgi:hypothetical protein
MLIYLIYSLLFLLVWMTSFSVANYNFFSIAIAFLYTFYSAYFVKGFVVEETTKLKIIKMIGPTFYFCTAVFMMVLTNWIMIFHSIIINFGIFVCTLFDKKLFPSKKAQAFVFLLSVFYASYMHEWISNYRLREAMAELADFSKNNPEEEKAEIAKTKTFKLNDFSFINSANDTIKLENTNKLIVLEYWNDVIGSMNAYQSFEQMHSFWAAQNNLAYYPVYHFFEGNREINKQKLYHHPKIKNPENILIESKMLDSLGVEMLPAYLIYNQEGVLIFKQEGYNPAERFAIQNKILKAIQNK